MAVGSTSRSRTAGGNDQAAAGPRIPLRETALAVPPICEGRQSIVDKIMALIVAVFWHDRSWPLSANRQKPTPIVIHGEGGMGKSTVAMKVLTDSMVESIFGRRRTFVQCDGIKSRDALLDHIVGNLGIKALAIFTSLGDSNGEAYCLLDLAKAALDRGDHDAGAASASKALTICQSIADRKGEALCLHDLARAALGRSDLTAATRFAKEALTIFRSNGDRNGEAWCLDDLARAALGRGDPNRAAVFANAELAIFQGIGNKNGEALCLLALARIALERGNADAARSAASKALKISKGLGNKDSEASCLLDLARVGLQRCDLEGAAVLANEALAMFRSIGNRNGEAGCLGFLSEAASYRRSLASTAKTTDQELAASPKQLAKLADSLHSTETASLRRLVRTTSPRSRIPRRRIHGQVLLPLTA